MTMKERKNKTHTKLAVTALGAAFLCCFAAVGVACGGTQDDKLDEKPNDQNKTAVITFIEGIDGDTSSFTYIANVGDTLGSVLQNVNPKTVDALEFGGWFEGDAPVEESATVTAEGLTLTAKYLASYAVSEYTQNTSGAYGAAKTTEGRAWYGEPFSYDYSLPEHCTLGEKPEGDGYADAKLSTESLGKREAFTVYYALDRVTATYHLNAPTQAGVSDESFEEKVYYGGIAPTKEANAFTTSLSKDYRFAGWATSADGEAVYDAGDEYTFDKSVDFYAKWDVAKTDVNGGSDRLFVSSQKGENGVIILCREGMEEKRGTVNKAGVFSFSEDGKTVLDGRIEDDIFYYYTDALQKKYAAFDGTQATMEFKAHGEAMYTPAEGDAIAGSYLLNVADGSFYFEGKDKGFVFTLVSNGREMVFRTVSEEAGYYALKTDEGFEHDVIYLNGLGGVTYFFTEDGGETTELQGNYECSDSKTQTYALSLYSEAGASVLDAVIRLTELSGTLDGYTLSGVYEVGDEYAGKYSVEGASLVPDVYVLDGFGAGSKNGKAGTYTVESTASWRALQNGTVYEVTAYWVRFTTNDGVSVDLDFGEDLYGTSVTTIEAGSLYGKYDFESAVLFNGKYYRDAFFIIENTGFSNGKYAYLWLGTQAEDGTAAYVQADEGSVIIDGNKYKFLNIDFHSFEFTVSENKTVRCIDIDTVIFDDETGKLLIDGDGNAQYTPAGGKSVEIEYSVEEGVVFVSTFRFESGDRKFVLQSDDGDASAVEIMPQNVYEIGYLTQDRQNNYTARLIRLTEETAILGLLIENSDSWYYCYYGSWGENTDGDQGFIAMNSAFPENAYLDVYEEYGYFLFRTDTVNGVNYFYQYDEAFEIECEAGRLVTDGYSVAEYTPASGEKITGTYSYDGNFVIVTTADGDKYTFRIIDPEHFELSESPAGKESGYYYAIDDAGDGTSYYFYLDGKGTAILYNGSSARWGTYEKTSYIVLNVYEEYCLTFSAGGEGQPTKLEYHLLLVPGGMIADENLYVQRDETQFGEYDVYESGAKVGELVGDGYFECYYILGDDVIAEGMLVRCDVQEDDYTQEIDYYPSTDGKHVLFLATDDDGEVTAEYLFDLNKEGKAVLRKLDYGTYGHYENGKESGDYIYLDGHGGATVFNAKGEKTDEGEYREFPESGEGVYYYQSGKGETNFQFTLYTVNGRSYFAKYTEKKVYAGLNWSALVLDGFGEAVYIDRYGMRTVGDGISVAEGVAALRPYENAETLYFEINADGSFRPVTDGWVVRNGVLLLYTGGRASRLRVPDGITTIPEGTIPSDVLDYLEYIDLNGVTEIGANAFKGSSLTEISSEALLKIGNGAFKNSSLQTAHIPSVTEIGAEAFYGCSSLVKVVLADIQKIGANAFTRSAYSSTVTLELTGVSAFSSIELSDTAFKNTADGTVPIRIVVADVAAMNGVYATGWADEIKASARIASRAKDSVSGESYIDLMSGTVYTFTGGEIAKDVCKDNDYAEEDSSVLALYYIDTDGFAVPYSQINGVWTEAAKTDVSRNVMSLDGVTVWKGNTDDWHEFTDSVTGKLLSFSVTISRSASSYGLSLTVRVQQYYFSFGDESGSGMLNLKYHISEHKFTFTAADGQYEVTVTGEGTCTSVKKTAE